METIFFLKKCQQWIKYPNKSSDTHGDRQIYIGLQIGARKQQNLHEGISRRLDMTY